MTASEPENPLRWRFCRAADCGALFFICKHCDRGQLYCSDRCRSEERRRYGLKQVAAISDPRPAELNICCASEPIVKDTPGLL
jgi:hypothetical protein